MASLMLEEELRFYMQRNHNGKRSKGKSRDALFRANGTSTVKVPNTYKGGMQNGL